MHDQAAVRELWEETGLTPISLFAVPSVNHFYEWQTDRLQLIPAFAFVSGGSKLQVLATASTTFSKMIRGGSYFRV